MAVGKGRNVGRLVNWELQLLLRTFFTTMVWSSTRSPADAIPNLLSITNPYIPITLEQDPEILELLCWSRSSPPNQRGQSTIFWQGTMNSDLDLQTLILTASHLAANHPSACWWSQAKEANKTTASAKSSDFFWGSLYCPWLRLKILSIRSNSHWEQACLGAEHTDTALTLVIKGLDSL